MTARFGTVVFGRKVVFCATVAVVNVENERLSLCFVCVCACDMFDRINDQVSVLGDLLVWHDFMLLAACHLVT